MEEWNPGMGAIENIKEFESYWSDWFALARGIDKEPAFTWWVPYILRRRDRIIAGLNYRVKRTTHKYGIELPRSVDKALRYDKLNGNTF